MAIKLTDKIHTVSADIDTTNRGSAQANAGRAAYTLQDVSDLIGGGGGGGVTSIVAGTNVTISPSGGTGNVTINAATGISGSGTAEQIAVFTASGAIGNSLLSVDTAGGVNYVYVGSSVAPVQLLIGAASKLVMQKQVSAPSSATTAGTAGETVTFFDIADPADAANGLYVCTNSGVAGSASWSKAALTAVA